MLHKLAAYIYENRAQVESNLIDAVKSLTISISSVAALQRFAGWLLETAGACVSAAIVSIFVWFVMRWFEKKYPRPNRKDPYGDRD